MYRMTGMIGACLLGVALQGGCHDSNPPPPRVAIPTQDQGIAYRYDEQGKPLPPPQPDDLPPPAYIDAPLVNQRPPEQRAFVDAYRHVGRPRILVFVNRSLEGQALPVNSDGPLVSPERGARDSGEYLRAGQYDEASAKSIDYAAMENILTDWLSADGQVQIISPLMARQRLTDEQFKDMQSGRPRMLGEVARLLDAEVLIQAQAHPTRQTPQGLEIRLVAEAVNIKGGESIGRAVLDVTPPLDKPQISKFTRFLARKLMDGMINSWESFGPPTIQDRAAPPPPPATRPIESAPPQAPLPPQP